MNGMTGIPRRYGRRLWLLCQGYHRDRNANVAIVFAICLIPLLAAIGGAVDFSRYYDTRAAVQNALDASVLAGAAENSATIAATTFNSWNVSVNGSAVTLTSASYTGCTSGDTSCTGTYSGSVRTYFAMILGMKTIPLNVTATAEKSATSSTTTNNICMWLVSTSSGLSLNSGASINGGSTTTAACEIDVAATSSGSSTLNSGSSVITSKLCIAATSINNNGGTVNNGSSTSSTLSTGCTVTSFLSSVSSTVKSALSTVPSATSSYSSYNCNSVLSPGVYTGDFNFNSGCNVTFNSGVYILKSAQFTFNSVATGSGVTFYFADSNSSFVLNSGAQTTFSAPTSGTYAGILMFEPSAGTTGSDLSSTSWNLGGSGTQNWSGIIYMPSKKITLNSGFAIDMTSGALVLASLSPNGQLILPTSGASVSAGTGTIVRLKT